MKYLKQFAAIAAIALIVGCASQQRTTYSTLASVETATSAAYSSYLDAVIQNKIPTNSVPTVSRDYGVFQAVWVSAVSIAQWNTNAPPTQSVTDAAAKVINEINANKP